MKNIVHDERSITNASSVIDIAVATDNPDPSTSEVDCSQGSIIKAIWFSVDFCGTGASGTNNAVAAYVFKNPGNNLTPPTPSTEGLSNEKKFIFKQWSAMIMATSDGVSSVHWEGWLKIPKRYQRMGLDDKLQFVVADIVSGLTGHSVVNFIYKYYS